MRFYPHVRHDDIALRVNVIAIKIGDVILVLLNDGIFSCRRVCSFTPGRELRDANEQTALIKICTLLRDADLYGGLPAESIPIPVRDRILRSSSRSGPIGAAKVLGLGREARVINLATAD